MPEAQEIIGSSREPTSVAGNYDVQVGEDGTHQLDDSSDYSYDDDDDDDEAYVLEPSLEGEDDEEDDEEISWVTKAGSKANYWWASLEPSERLHDILRNDSRGEVAENYHHDHLLHQKWPSESRPPLRRGKCVICPRRRKQVKPKMAAIEALADERTLLLSDNSRDNHSACAHSSFEKVSGGLGGRGLAFVWHPL